MAIYKLTIYDSMLTGLGFKPNQQTCSHSLSSFEILQELDPTFHHNKLRNSPVCVA